MFLSYQCKGDPFCWASQNLYISVRIVEVQPREAVEGITPASGAGCNCEECEVGVDVGAATLLGVTSSCVCLSSSDHASTDV